MPRITTSTLAVLLVATAALAHSGVKDPQVKARMAGMSVLGEETKVLGQMAKGATPFNAAKAQAAITKMQVEAKRIPALFEPQADDPKSESKPAIWTDWAKFQAHVTALTDALARADVSKPGSLNASVRAIGGACGACHKQFRE